MAVIPSSKRSCQFFTFILIVSSISIIFLLAFNYTNDFEPNGINSIYLKKLEISEDNNYILEENGDSSDKLEPDNEFSQVVFAEQDDNQYVDEDQKNEEDEVVSEELKEFILGQTSTGLEKIFNRTNYNENIKKKIYIISNWRSGSTFLGEAISSHPAIFYFYEPLSRFQFQDLSSGPLLEEALEDLNNLGQCNYQSLKKYLDYAQTDKLIFHQNSNLQFACGFPSIFCYDPTFLHKMCSLFPIQLYKLVRIRAPTLRNFLMESKDDEDIHFIFLVRDPRAVYSSRKKLSWCMNNLICSTPKLMCDQMTQDLQEYYELQLKYPEKIHLVRYEDMAKDPKKYIQDLLNKLGIIWHKYQDDYLFEHTTTNLDKPWSTIRRSKDRVDLWRTELSQRNKAIILTECSQVISNLTYVI